MSKNKFQPGDYVRVRQMGGGVGETLWEIVSVEGFNCKIRDVQSADRTQFFDTSLLQKATGPALQPRGTKVEHGRMAREAERDEEDRANLAEARREITPLKFEDSETGRAVKLIAILQVEADALEAEGNHQNAQRLRDFCHFSLTASAARLAKRLGVAV